MTRYRPSELVSGAGTARRIQALAACGWPQRWVGAQLGLSQQRMSQLTRATTVTVTLAKAIADLYEELWDREPPVVTGWDRAAVTLAMKAAAVAGWCPPMAWDDDNDDGHGIDDPDATPAPAWKRTRKTDPAGLAEDTRWLMRQDMSRRQIAVRLGVTRDAIDVALTRHPAPRPESRTA